MPTVIKHSFVKGAKTSSKISAHINYIQYRKDTDREKGARPFHTSKLDDLTGRELKQTIRDDLTRGDVVHKIIVSPGNNDVNIVDYTREMMSELGRAKGQELRYAFVTHENTEHYHAHVIVLGRDEQGGRVRLDKLDHMRMRAFGDRYLERELNIERVLDRDMEQFCRQRGLNIMHEQERGDYFYERLYKGDPKKSSKGRNPEDDVREWEKFNNDWKIFIQEREGMEYGSLRQTSFHAIGKQADLSQIIHNKEQTDFWKELGESNPDRKEEADRKLEELEQQRQEIQEQIDDKTKAFNPWQIFDKVARDFDREDAQLRALLNAPVGSPIGASAGLTGKGNTDIDLEQIPEAERIEAANGRTYTKYDSRADLMALDEFLKESSDNWIEYEKYQMLGSWLTAKEHYGDDCYGRPPLKEKELEPELKPELQKQPELDNFLGFDESERELDRSNPLLTGKERASDQAKDLDIFLGFDADERDMAEQSFDMVELFGVSDLDKGGQEHERDDDSDYLTEIGWQ